jgi:translocator protein
MALLAFLAVCFVVAGIGGAVTRTSVETWYPTLAKPAFTPPDWVFGPVWTVLYAIMALAAWLVWRRTGWQGSALTLFFVQLALNLMWSILFFGLQLVGLALVDIVVLVIVIALTTIAFWRVDRRVDLGRLCGHPEWRDLAFGLSSSAARCGPSVDSGPQPCYSGSEP